MKYVVRALLAVAMLVGVYALVLGVVGAFAYGMYTAVTSHANAVALGKLAVVGVVVAVVIGKRAWQALRRPDVEPSGVAVTQAQQPLLWSEARSLADHVGTRPPDEIRLVAEVDAVVSEDSRWLGLVPGTRRMYVGVPLLIGLSADQLRSVLAHELAHHGGRHSALTSVTYRGREALRGVVDHLGEDSWTGRLFGLYARLYAVVAEAVYRRRELEADRFAAEVAGPGVAVAALREVTAVHAGWDSFLHTHAQVGVGQGRRPADLFGGFQRYWRSPTGQAHVARARVAPLSRERSPHDTHPSVAERVAAIERLGRAHPRATRPPGPAVDLLVGTAATFSGLEEHLFRDSDLEPVPWDRLVEEARAGQARDQAALLVAAMERGGQTRADVGAVLKALGQGWVDELVEPLLDGPSTPEQRAVVAGQVVGDLVADALVAGGCRFALTWHHEPRLVTPDGEPVDPWSVARRAVADPRQVAALRRWCTHNRVPLGYRPEPPVRSVETPVAHPPLADDSLAPRPRPVGDPVEAGAYLATVGRSRFVFVLPSGLVVKGCTPGDAWRIAMSVWAFGAPGTWPVRARLRRGATHLLGRRRVRFLPWSDLDTVTLRHHGANRVALGCRSHDGQVVEVTGLQGYLYVEGDLFGRLAHHLGERFVVEVPATRSGSQRVTPGP